MHPKQIRRQGRQPKPGGSKKIVNGVPLSMYLDEDIDEVLKVFLAESVPKVSKSSVVRAALRQFLGMT
jgi:hypothetical protein